VGATLHTRLLVVLLLVAATVRVVFIVQFHATDLATIPLLDCEAYHDWAVRLTQGDWGWNETYWMGPLYPHLLALLYVLFGTGHTAVIVLQLGLNLLNIWLVWRLGLALFPAAGRGPTVALVAAALYAFYGAPVFYGGLRLMATVVTTGTLAISLLGLRAVCVPTVRNWFIVGTVVGLTGLARGNVLLLLAGLPLLLWMESETKPELRHRRLRYAIVLVAGGLLLLAPATLRNIIVARDFVVLTSNGGVNLLIGQQADYKGIFVPIMDEAEAEFDPSMEPALERELGRELKGSEVSRTLTRRAWNTFRDDLRAMPLHYLRKAYRFWNGYELPQIVSYDHWRQEFGALRVLMVPFTLLSALGLLGLCYLPRPGRSVVLVLVAVYFVSLLPFFPTSRYRQPIAPLLAIGAAAYLVTLATDLARRRHRVAGIRLAVAVLTLAALNPGWAALDQPAVTWQVHLHEASRASKRGDLRTALAKGRAAEAARPGLSDTPFHLALLLEEMGAHDEALAALRLAAARAPDHRLIPYRIGRNYEELRRTDEALAAFTEAAALDPDWSLPWLRSGLVLRRAGRIDEALTAMEAAYLRSSGDHRIRANLASLYAETGHPDRAAELLEQLVRDYPLYINGWFNLALVELTAGRLESAESALNQAAAIPGVTESQERQIDQLKQLLLKTRGVEQ